MKIHTKNTFLHKISRMFLVFLVFFGAVDMRADDPGISKVRLIQTGEKTYMFETDITQQLLWTLKNPIFSDRFIVSEPQYTNESGWITIRIEISTEAEGLNPNDQIILPWVRNAADISAQWLDGESFKGLYYRTFEGIHIPIKDLMPSSKTTKEVLMENFNIGLSHFPFHGIHILFIIALVLLIPNKEVLKALVFMTVGQLFAMLTISLNLSFATLLFSDLLIILLIGIIAYCIVSKKTFKNIGIALFIVGFVHSVAYVNDSELIQPRPEIHKIQGLFAFNLATDLGHYLTAILILGILRFPKVLYIKKNSLVVAIGSLSVFLMLMLGNEYVLAGEQQILKTDNSPNITYNANQGASTQNEVNRGSAEMTTPIMVFLSVEPYEVRQEILVMGRAANRLLAFQSSDETTIATEKQEQIKQDLLDLIVSKDSIVIDGKRYIANEAKANFVTLGPGGVSIRESAIEENMDEALIGVSLLYEFEGYPSNIETQWRVFPDDVQYIEYQAVDAHANTTRIISPEENGFAWETKMKGYQIKEIEPIVSEPTPRPLASYIIWIFLGVVVLLFLLKKKQVVSKQTMIFLLVLSFVCYPFVRTTASMGLISQGKPSEEKATAVLEDLLTNVYRAFDRRNENAVYDRLSMSVTEDQLGAIYLQNRQSMAIENRGGARANVDEVKVKELYDIQKAEGEGYIGDVSWTVRGSVNHYGHTHYRQNEYRALVSFLVEDGIWKISNFEIIDTQRLY